MAYVRGTLNPGESLLISWQRALVGASQVFVFDQNGLHQITQNTGWDFHNGYWTTDPQTCFITTQYGNAGHLYLYETTGSQIRELAQNGRVKNGLLLSPDGRYLAYWAHPVEDGGGLILLDWQNDARTVIPNIQRPLDKCWADDSQSLAVIALPADDTPLWVRVGWDGRELERYAMPQFNDRYELTLSPDWQRVAYVWLDEADESHLMVAKRDGTEEQRLGMLNDMESPPVWSPDGESIAWVGSDGTDLFKLFVADAEGMNIRQLMVLDEADDSGEIYPGHPVWSSDSTHLAMSSFVVNPAGSIEDGTFAGTAVFVVNVSSGAVRQVSDPAGIIFTMQWRPR
jgi:Tol biopolymer transport system component